jgi:hypothetical protein
MWFLCFMCFCEWFGAAGLKAEAEDSHGFPSRASSSSSGALKE